MDSPPSEVWFRRGADVAEWFDVQEKTLARWRRRDQFPARTGKGYGVRAIGQWLAHRAAATPSGLAEVKTALLQLDLREREGELVDVTEVQRVIAGACSTARALLSELPDRLIKVLDLDGTAAETTRGLARGVVNNALESLAAISLEMETSGGEGDDESLSGTADV